MPRQKEFDEAEVLDQAVELFRARGYQSTSFSDLTTELRVSRQSLYDTYCDKQTSITVALSYAGDRTLFTEHVERKHNFNFENVQAHLIYLTSLGHVWEKAYEKVYEFAKKTDVLLAFNPGSLQLEN